MNNSILYYKYTNKILISQIFLHISYEDRITSISMPPDMRAGKFVSFNDLFPNFENSNSKNARRLVTCECSY